jgi:hypothetical protein
MSGGNSDIFVPGSSVADTSTSTNLNPITTTANAPGASGPTPYAQRILSYEFAFGTGDYGDSGATHLNLGAPTQAGKPGLRSTFTCSKAQLPNVGYANIRIFGMTLSQINDLTKAGYYWATHKNLVAVQAGDAQAGLTTIFNGQIYQAYPDFNTQPDVSFVILANDFSPNGAIHMKPVTPVSFPGAVPIATALTQVLQTVPGITLENNGVNTVLSRPYLWGTAWQQINQIVKAADCFSTLDSTNGVLAIWPKSGYRTGSPLTLSPGTGMIGYPEFQAQYMTVRSLFNPAVKGTGFPITVQSQLTAANGVWILDNLDYNLSTETPGGPWEMALHLHPKSLPDD